MIESRIQELSAERALRLTLHAQQEMLEDGVSIADLLACLEVCTVIEEYPDHRRGACCLVCCETAGGRPLHLVCTTERPELIIITVYEPKPPKWETPFVRGKRT